MSETTLLRDLAVVMVVAGAITLLFRYLRQPPILGYLLAGLVVGPYTPPTSLVSNPETIRLLADLGIVLLMFGIGLEFTWDKLRETGRLAIIIGAIQTPFMLALGYALGRFLGWPLLDSLFLAAALSISSSVIIFKILQDLGKMRQVSSRLVIGILVVEDFAAVAMLAVLSGLAGLAQIDLANAGMLLLKLAIFAAAILFFGALVVPRIIDFAARFHSRESLLVVSLALCFALAILSRFLGLSVAVGAFLMGVLVGETRQSEEISLVVSPIRDFFAALFFVTMGMLIDISLFRQFLVPALVVSLLFVLGKVLVNSLGTFLCGFGGKTPLRVGLAMGAMGEFSLFFVKFGQESQAVGTLLYPIIATATIITTFTSAYLTSHSDAVIQRLDKATPREVKLYFSYLGEWLRALRGRFSRRDRLSQEIQQAILGILVNFLIIGVLVGGGSLALPYLRNLAGVLRLESSLLSLIFSLAILAFCLPPGIALWRNLRVLLNDAAGYLVGCSPSAKTCGREGVRTVLRNSFGLVIIVLLGILFLPFFLGLFTFGSFLSLLPYFLVGVAVFLSWGALAQIHSRLENTFKQRLMKPGVSAEGKEEEEGWRDV